MLREFTCDCEK